MKAMIERLHKKFLHLPHVSTALVKRHMKMTWEESEKIRDMILERRDKAGIPRWVKPRYGKKVNSKLRRIVNIMPKASETRQIDNEIYECKTRKIMGPYSKRLTKF